METASTSCCGDQKQEVGCPTGSSQENVDFLFSSSDVILRDQITTQNTPSPTSSWGGQHIRLHPHVSNAVNHLSHWCVIACWDGCGRGHTQDRYHGYSSGSCWCLWIWRAEPQSPFAAEPADTTGPLCPTPNVDPTGPQPAGGQEVTEPGPEDTGRDRVFGDAQKYESRSSEGHKDVLHRRPAAEGRGPNTTSTDRARVFCGQDQVLLGR